ncbi:MAG TPA: serine/threonine-protein kinase [Sandaracinaceae bacterium LLY-WYZ-13_1]|nr:serine/threonine-protein kinase [Sandaracinaceae bacterium LLY-WYZ-13_1]
MSSDPTTTSSADVLSSQTVRLAPVTSARFDDYVIVGKLGHGGMAEVYLAFEEGLGGFRKLVVIKRLHKHLGEEPEMVEMFLDEARLAARLNHPHVVQTNKIGSFEGYHFLAMEYLEGQPLSKLLKRLGQKQRAIPAPLVARIVSDALDGLDYAHEATDFDGTPLNIVHRDVSPQNIFVTYDGAVKLLDFGIAKAEIQEALTRTGLVKGKFAYIAPEQAQGDRLDRRADIWAMGVVLWEALTGRRLFKSSNELATLNETLTKPIDAPDLVEPSVPRELSEIAMRALQRDPDARYATAGAMKDDLDEWLAGSSKGGSRRTLVAFVKEVFADTIDEQRALIRRCVEQVDASKVGALPEGEPSGDATRVERKAAISEEVSALRAGPADDPVPAEGRRRGGDRLVAGRAHRPGGARRGRLRVLGLLGRRRPDAGRRDGPRPAARADARGARRGRGGRRRARRAEHGGARDRPRRGGRRRERGRSGRGRAGIGRSG